MYRHVKGYERISSTDVLEDFYISIFYTTSVWVKNHCNITSGKLISSLYASNPHTQMKLLRILLLPKFYQRTILNELHGRRKKKVNPKQLGQKP